VAVAQLPMYSPQSIANLIWAYSATRHHAPELFDAVADRAVEIMYEVRTNAKIQKFKLVECPANGARAGLRLAFFNTSALGEPRIKRFTHTHTHTSSG
jgi:hypothetical protein